MTYLLEIKKDYALALLEVLQQQGAIEMRKVDSDASATIDSSPQGEASFNALRLDTRGIKFNRYEANER